MKARSLSIIAAIAALTLITERNLSTQPSFNGSTPGCTGSGCHSLSDGIVSVSSTNLTVSVSLSGNSGAVAGELVNGSGTVVATNNSTTSNPFTLAAPGPGVYRVNAGYKSPNRLWDSALVVVVGATSVREEMPLHTSLDGNYPNPFNPSTTIAFTLSQPVRASLKIFDIRGTEVTTLVDGLQEPGRHTVRFDGTGLSSGIYLYRLEAGDFSATRRLLLIR